jgi:phosphatidylglycerophosphate synthase
VDVSVQHARLRARLDAAAAVLGSVALGFILINLHSEHRTVSWVAFGAGLTLVSVAAVSVVRRRPTFSTSADRVTLFRAVLAGGCATIVTLSVLGSNPPRTWLLIAIAVPALLLDAVDGWVARRTGTANAHGARLDMETDAALLMVLSIPVAFVVGPWALAIGAMRYLFVAASWVRPALRQPLKFSSFRRVTAGAQGAVLAFAATPIVPVPVAGLTTLLALAMLAFSFGKDVVSLERAYRRSRATAR